MATPTQLATGLGGAIGSDFVLSRNEVYFVEFNGNLSVLDLVRPLAGIVSQGTTTIKGTWIFDCETGTLVAPSSTRDIWWEQIDSVKRLMVPQNGARIFNLGAVDFNAITAVELQNLPYSTTPIIGNNDASNKLVAGDVFAVLTNAGNFCKIKVLHYGYDLQVQWMTYKLAPRYRVIGTGYSQPEDIKVTSGGRYAYVTERAGNLLRVDLTNANRPAALVVASGMTAPHQIALDEAHGQAYVAEFTDPATRGSGRIYRIDLSSGLKTAVYTGLRGCTGLLLSNDFAFAYVAEQTGGGRIARINLATGQNEVLVNGVPAPFFMEWADSTRSQIFVPERDPSNQIVMVNLATTPVSVTTLISGVPFRPSSLVMTTPGKMVVCSDTEINLYDLSASVFSLAGPLFMGIGLVPVDHIINTGNNDTDGYADTTDNPGYMLQVKDAPFGGALAIMLNHNAALLAGATYYKVFVNQVTPAATAPVEPRQSFSDYLWSATSFVPQTTVPAVDGFYPVRLPTQIWYNPLLGYMLDTSILANGLAVIEIKLYNAAKVEIPVASIHSRRVKIDNQWPVAKIEKILHDGLEVQACDIVNSGTDQFTFAITATDPEGHLLSWSVSAAWGDNKSGTVAGDDYSHHVAPNRKWAGLSSAVVPSPAWPCTVAGDPTSTHCAHTFYLGVWDRVINGYGYIHNQTYHKSITIWL